MRSRFFDKRRLAGLCAALLLGVGHAAAQDPDAFQQGLDAYLAGDYPRAREIWRPAAQAGDAVAAFNLGVLHAQGLGVTADQALAVRWYRRSAMAGYANAQFNLGAAYYSGDGVERNLGLAASWWEKAAAQGHSEALYNLATLYRRGMGVAQDQRRAVSLFNKAASLGDTRAQQALTEIGARPLGSTRTAETGELGETDTGETDTGETDTGETDTGETDTGGAARGQAGGQTAGEAGTAAPAGPPLAGENPEHWTVQVFAGTGEQAAMKFASKYDLGARLRIYQALIDGKTWFKGVYGSFPGRAGAREAQQRLARQLPGADPWLRQFRSVQAEAVGESVVAVPAAAQAAPARKRDPGTVQTGASDAAANDPAPDPAPDPDAPPDGAQTGVDPATAAAPEEAGPAAGAEPSARLQRGRDAYESGDYVAAFEAWRPLALEGEAAAQYGIGRLYAGGHGVTQDYGEAFAWYQRAAQQGNVEAQYALGRLYRDGQGVARNDALGLYWIQSAADRGEPRAAEYLQQLN